MSVVFEESVIPGAGLIIPPVHFDARGFFTKPFSPDVLASCGIEFTATEVYWSESHVGVVRGLHLQIPPRAIAKIAFVISGFVRDIVLDLRRGSPTEGAWVAFELRPGSGAALVPEGCAHGFEVIEGPAAFCSIQSGPLHTASEVGIRWDSAGVDFRSRHPIVSERDSALPALAEFDSPFVFQKSA